MNNGITALLSYIIFSEKDFQNSIQKNLFNQKNILKIIIMPACKFMFFSLLNKEIMELKEQANNILEEMMKKQQVEIETKNKKIEELVENMGKQIENFEQEEKDMKKQIDMLVKESEEQIEELKKSVRRKEKRNH